MTRGVLDRDVFGDPVPGPLEFTLSHDGFVPKFPASAKPVTGAKPGSFHEGLWEGDVAEVFLMHPGGGYLEYNFAPNGAWWSCAFDSPRVRSSDPAPVPFPKFEPWVGNVTAIIGGRYLSLARLGGTQPDFHRPQDFIALF